jgi:hypothetical protein
MSRFLFGRGEPDNPLAASFTTRPLLRRRSGCLEINLSLEVVYGLGTSEEELATSKATELGEG